MTFHRGITHGMMTDVSLSIRFFTAMPMGNRRKVTLSPKASIALFSPESSFSPRPYVAAIQVAASSPLPNRTLGACKFRGVRRHKDESLMPAGTQSADSLYEIYAGRFRPVLGRSR